MKQTERLQKFHLETMSKFQERAIFAAIRGGDKALKERFIQSAMGEVSHLANEALNSEVTFEELFSEARAALIAAMEHFDDTTNERFLSFYRRCARLRLQKFHRNLSWFLPIDPAVLQLHDRFELALLELYPTNEQRESDRVHDEAYVADYLGVSVEELRNMKREYEMCRIDSLNETVYLDEPTLDEDDREVDFIETIADPATDNGAADYLDGLMDGLSDDERYIVCAKSGVLETEERTDAQLASELGLNKREVNAIYEGAIKKIKKAGTHH